MWRGPEKASCRCRLPIVRFCKKKTSNAKPKMVRIKNALVPVRTTYGPREVVTTTNGFLPGLLYTRLPASDWLLGNQSQHRFPAVTVLRLVFMEPITFGVWLIP